MFHTILSTQLVISTFLKGQTFSCIGTAEAEGVRGQTQFKRSIKIKDLKRKWQFSQKFTKQK